MTPLIGSMGAHSRRRRRPRPPRPSVRSSSEMPAGLAFLARRSPRRVPPAEAPAAPATCPRSSRTSSPSPRAASRRPANGPFPSGGLVVARGGDARWELTHGTFPRSSATSVVTGRGGLTLLDREDEGGGTRNDLGLRRSLPGAAGRPGLRRARGAGRGGRAPEGRYRPSVPGPPDVTFPAGSRVDRRPLVAGPDHAREDRGHRSSSRRSRWPRRSLRSTRCFRLLPARGAAREALDAELAKVTGFPVFVEISVTSTSSTEAPGIPSGTEPPPRPLTAHSTVTRRVGNLAARPGVRGDEARVAVPEDFRAVSLDRLLVGPAIP